MKYLDTKKKKIIYHHINHFCDSLYFVFLFRINLDPPPENGIAINFGTTEFGSGNIQPYRTYSICSSTYLQRKAASSDDEILSQDIEVVVIKQVKKAQPTNK
jgi:hypothetical protein